MAAARSGRVNDWLPFVKDKEGGKDKAGSADSIIPFEFFAEVGDGEDCKDREGNNFLDGFELCSVEFVRADAVGGNLEAIFEKSDAPTGNDHFPERFAAIFEMAVPGEGHEDVGNG